VPYLYTRVQCCDQHGDLHSKYDITAPSKVDAILQEAASVGLSVPLVGNRISACALPHFPPRSKVWSGSPDCVNAAFVEDSAQHVVALTIPFQGVVLFFVLAVGGSIADAHGRRPVLMAYCLMCLLACITYALDTKLCHIWGNAIVLIAGMLICPCLEAKEAVMAGSIADLVGETTSGKKSALTLLYACCKTGSMVGFLISFCILKLHVSNYFLPWVAYSCVALCIVAFTQLLVPETLAKNRQTGLRSHMFNPLSTYFHTFKFILMDRTLVLLLVFGLLFSIHLTGMMSILFSYLRRRGFSQEEAILPGVLSSFVQILSAACLARYRHRIDVMNRVILGSVAMALAYVVLGPISAFIGHASAYLAFAFCGIGEALAMPAILVIVSEHVGEEKQARCQSAFAGFSKIGKMIGPIIWSSCFFDATATGFAEMRPVIASLVLAVVCTALSVYMRIQDAPGLIREPDDTVASPLVDKLSMSAKQSYGNA